MATAIIGLLGVLIGAVIGLASQLLATQMTNFRVRKNLASAFAAEIASIIDIVQRRRYLQDIQAVLTAIQALPDETPFPPEFAYTARVNLEYFTVFNSNSDKLGMLGPVSGDIVTFYTFAKAIIEDLSSLYGGERVLRTIGEARRFYTEITEIMTAARERGNSAVQVLRQVEGEKLYRIFK